MTDLHLRIRGWREHAGLTRIELARRVGVSAASVTYWEAEKGHGPLLDKIGLICDACGITVAEFFSSIPEKPADPPELEPAASVVDQEAK